VSHYTPLGLQFDAPSISRQSKHEGEKVVSPTHRPHLPLQEILLVLISVRNRVAVTLNPLTPELNPSTQRCLTIFLLGILLLEPRISLIYA
jgi:hypothetical protein